MFDYSRKDVRKGPQKGPRGQVLCTFSECMGSHTVSVTKNAPTRLSLYLKVGDRIPLIDT